MNENLNLEEILKDCQKRTKLYSPIFGDVLLSEIREGDDYPIVVVPYPDQSNLSFGFDCKGRLLLNFDGECMLFPSREQRDWSKFKVEKPKFDPKTLQPFDRVLVHDSYDIWQAELFSHVRNVEPVGWCQCLGDYYGICIPCNEETKHLVGTSDEAPEFYRYWED